MTILNRLASSLRRRDEVANQLLAEEIVRTSAACSSSFTTMARASGLDSLEKESQKKPVARVLKKVMA